MNQNVGVSAIGDVLDINCWSNIPYFFYQAGNRKGFLNQPWRLDLSNYDFSRKLWNIHRLLTFHKPGGFQYSKTFLDQVENAIPKVFYNSTVISFNQVFPNATKVVKAGGEIYYYIDTTLYDLFKEPSYALNVPNDMLQKAIALEQENYRNATAIVSMGEWSHDSLRLFYGLDESKIHRILPGANIEIDEAYNRPFIAGAGITRSLVLGFIGKDWERKGLPLLLQIRDVLSRRGYNVVVRAVGNCPEQLKNRDGLDFTGFINKQSDSETFVKTVSTCDIGCLFSASEALGISTLEFIKMGIPVAGFYHQGLRDTLLDGVSFRFALNATTDEIANEFEKFILDENIQLQMHDRLTDYRSYVTWDRCIDDWCRLINTTED